MPRARQAREADRKPDRFWFSSEFLAKFVVGQIMAMDRRPGGKLSSARLAAQSAHEYQHHSPADLRPPAGRLALSGPADHLGQRLLHLRTADGASGARTGL